jgi:hypothetical protein
MKSCSENESRTHNLRQIGVKDEVAVGPAAQSQEQHVKASYPESRQEPSPMLRCRYEPARVTTARGKLRIPEVDLRDAVLSFASEFPWTCLQNCCRDFSAGGKHEPAGVHVRRSRRDANGEFRLSVFFADQLEMGPELLEQAKVIRWIREGNLPDVHLQMGILSEEFGFGLLRDRSKRRRREKKDVIKPPFRNNSQDRPRFDSARNRGL